MGYDPSAYGDRLADVYDELSAARSAQRLEAETAATVDFLRDRTGSGPALELGVGTGRVAIPLAAQGVRVVGVDASEKMLRAMRGKPGGERVSLVCCDMARASLRVRCTLVYVVASTLYGLLTQDDQLRCFAGAAACLDEGGRLVVECFVPGRRLDGAQRVEALHVDTERVHLEASRHDAARQRVSTQQVVIEDDRVRCYPVEIRYIWPSELDLMARLAGLTLVERWGGWKGEPFTSSSGRHVSEYRLH